MTLTIAAIFKQIASRAPNASEKLHSVLREFGLQDAASALADDANAQQQRLADALASLHAPDKQEKVLALLTDAAATAANMSYIKGYAQGRTDQKEADEPYLRATVDAWIKIAPGCNLPPNADVVDVYFGSSGDVERASYDADDNQWRSSFTCRAYPPEQIVTHWRIGSRPA